VKSVKNNVIQRKKRQTFFSLSFLLYVCVVIIIFGFWVLPSFGINVFPSILQFIIDYPQEPGYQKEFDSIKLPKDFKFVSSIFKNDYSEGALALHRRYLVQGTRETIIRELEPVFDEQGYNLSAAVKDLGTGNDSYNTIDNKTYGFSIELYPQNRSLSGCDTYSSDSRCSNKYWEDDPNEQVNYVEIILGP
jgi:hypothetical protein